MSARFANHRTLLLLALFVLPCVANVATPQRAFGADNGTLTATVLDADSKAPLVGRVELRGPLTTVDLTDASGKATFTDLPSGTYTVTVVSRRHVRIVLGSVYVGDGERSRVTVLMHLYSTLRTIAVAKVAAKPFDGTLIGPDDARADVSPSLTDALATIPGLTVDAGSGAGSPSTISLQGHPASQTALTLDDIPLNAPGVAGDLSRIDSDVFRSASVDFAPRPGGNGGSVNFRSVEPSVAFEQDGKLQYGTFDRGLVASNASGTIGRLGFAATGSARTNPALLDGTFFADSSQPTYLHEGAATSTSSLIKIVDRVGTYASIGISSLDSRRNAQPICVVETGALPCGYGTGADVNSQFRLASVRASYARSKLSVALSPYRTVSDTSVALPNRRSLGTSDPLSSAEETVTGGTIATASYAATAQDTLSVRLASASTDQRAYQSYARTSATTTSMSRYSTLTLNDAFESPNGFGATVDVGTTQASLAGANAFAGASAHLRLARGVDGSVALSEGSSVYADGRLATLSDPDSLVFDCHAGTATGTIGGDAPRRNSFRSISASLKAELPHGGIAVSAYSQRALGASAVVLTNGTAYDTAALSESYVAAARQIARDPSNCGEGSAISRSSIELATLVAGLGIRYDGLRVALDERLPGGIRIDPSLSLTRTVIDSSDPRLLAGASITRPGRQVVGVPLVAADLVAAYRAPRGSFEAIANLRYIGSDTGARLPAHVSADVGAGVDLATGNLSLVLDNAFNQYVSAYQTPTDATPYVTNDGGSVGTIARPNAPRQVFLRYSMAVGPNAVARRESLSQTIGIPANHSVLSGYLITPYSDTPPRDPLERNTGAACTAQARADSDKLVAYVKARLTTDLAVTADGDAAPPQAAIAGLQTETYVSKAPLDRSLVFKITALDVARNALSCLHVHVGAEGDARARGMFVPESASLSTVTLAFSTKDGFYVVNFSPQHGTLQSFRTYALPTSPPSEPFASRPSVACAGDVARTASATRAEFETYFARPADAIASDAPSWTIVRRGAAATEYFVLAPQRLEAMTSVFACARVSAATDADLAKRGFALGSLPAGTLLFIRSFGLVSVTAPAKT